MERVHPSPGCWSTKTSSEILRAAGQTQYRVPYSSLVDIPNGLLSSCSPSLHTVTQLTQNALEVAEVVTAQ